MKHHTFTNRCVFDLQICELMLAFFRIRITKSEKMIFLTAMGANVSQRAQGILILGFQIRLLCILAPFWETYFFPFFFEIQPIQIRFLVQAFLQNNLRTYFNPKRICARIIQIG